MAATTGQLGLVTPTQGTLTGTWGDTVNNGITEYTNIAIAGTLTLTGDGAVTLANTTGDASASNITSSLTGAGTVTAQFAIVKIAGTLTTTKIVTFGSAGSAPYSKTYTVVNSATGGAVTFKAYGQTGVSIAVGETAFVYYNGTDIVKVVGTATAGAAGGSTTQVQYNSSGVLAGSSNMTFDGTSLTLGGNPTLSAGTANGVTYLNGSKVLTSGSALTFDGTNFKTTGSVLAGGSAPSSGAGVTLTYNGTTGNIYSYDWGTSTYKAIGLNGNSVDISAAGNTQTTFGVNGSEVGRFTSTGLGIGTSLPVTKLDVTGNGYTGDPALPAQIRITAGEAYNLTPTSGILFVNKYNSSGATAGMGGISVYKENTTDGNYASALALFTRPNGGSVTKVATFDSAGNLGLGVTPSAWGNGKAIQVAGSSAAAALYQNSSGTLYLGNNYAFTSADKYVANGYATRYGQYSGQHVWETAGNNTSGAGAALSFSTAMTLDASGNLGVGTTSPSFRLDVQGSASFNNDAGRVVMIGSTNTATINYGGGIAFGGYYNGTTSFINDFAGIQGFKENSTAGDYAGALRFTTRSNGGSPTERFRISSNGAWGLSGANYGTAGQVLTSNGSGSAPTWQNAGGGGSAATPTTLGTVYGSQTSGSGSPYLSAYGYNAGSGNTGVSNTAFGAYALDASPSGEANNAFGVSALTSNTSGASNSAFGHNAMSSNTTGSANVAIGRQALDANTTSSNSVAIGYQALFQANPAVSGFGGDTVAIGFRAFYSLGTVASNGSGGCTAVGYQAGYSTTSAGNGANDTFIGSSAGYYNVSGYSCTFVGASAGVGQTSGNSNTIVGAGAGRQTSGAGGSLCTIVGTNAGSVNSGNDNTFVGAAAGASNAGAVSNAYFGTYAAQSATGSYNVALGAEAMYSATSVANNVAVGYAALRSLTSTTGYHTAVGYQALYSATDNSNVAVGYRSGYGVTSGHNNVLLGNNAGNSTVVLAGGAQNVVIGSGAYTNTTGAYNEIVIGQSCNGVGNDYVSIGKLNNRVYNHYDTNATWTQSSDVRLKKDIEDDSLGLSFINRLRPVKFRWKATNELELDNPHYNEVNNKNTTAVIHGLIAQEVKAALDEEGVSTFEGWTVEPNGIQGISREMFITPLINAVQELTAQVEALKAEVAALKGNV